MADIVAEDRAVEDTVVAADKVAVDTVEVDIAVARMGLEEDTLVAEVEAAHFVEEVVEDVQVQVAAQE